MAVFKPRERLVYFRISEDEFHQFVSVCEQEGARSVSDLARNAVQRLISDGDRHREDHQLTPKVQMLEKLIGELNSQLRVLTALLQTKDAEAAQSAKAGEAAIAPAEPSQRREE